MRETVQCVRHESLKVQEDSVCRQHDVSERSTLRSEIGESRDQTDCPDKDIDVQRYGASNFFRLQDFCPHKRTAQPAQNGQRQPQPERKRRDVCNRGRRRDAGHAPAEPDNKNQIENDVDAVQGQLMPQRGLRVLNADEPSQQCEIHQRRGRPPDPGKEVLPRQRFDLRRRFDDGEGNPGDWRLKNDQD